MLRVRLLLIVVIAFSLMSCATKSTFEKEEDQKRIKTAKINAQLGIAYLEQNNVQRSKQKLLRAMDQASDIPETWYSMAYFLEATGNKKEAASYYRKAIAVAPNRGDAKNNYGTFLCRSGRYHESIDQFLLAVDDHDYLDPADAFENAGICALKAPDKQLAEKYFKKALAEDPARPVSILKLAEIQYQGNDYKGSRAHLDEFLAISPPTTASQRLAKLLILQENGVLASQQTVHKVKAPRSKVKTKLASKKPRKAFKAKHRKKITAKKTQKKKLASSKRAGKKKIVSAKKQYKKKKLVAKKQHKKKELAAKKRFNKKKQIARKKVRAKKVHRRASRKDKVRKIAKIKSARTGKKVIAKMKSPVNRHIAENKSANAGKKIVARKKAPINKHKAATATKKRKVTLPLRPSPEKKYYHEHNVLAQNDSLAQGMLIT